MPDGLTREFVRTKLLRGSNSRASKLTEQDVLEIRRRAENGERYADIAEDFPVYETSIGEVARGDAWSTIGGPRQEERKSLSGESNPSAKLSESEVEVIRDRYNSENISYRDLAEEYGVSDVTIGNAVRGKTF